MPIGTVGALRIHRTMKHGTYTGLLTGMASCDADVLYACVGAFGLSFVSNFLFEYQTMIHQCGAMLLLIIAFAITNPAAILSFLFAFSVFEIEGALSLVNGIQLVIGVFIGTFLWWILLVIITNRMKRKVKRNWCGKANKIFGTILILFGIFVTIKVF